ncbi:MAG: hypothetical protein FJX56_03410 [Alphaproteobacteria bacterium]|nr:hypothetical protein [Alphaproteobacteria bacterium]
MRKGRALPAGFEAIERFVKRWALPTQNRRQARRRKSTTAELQDFYDDMLPVLPSILKHVDTFPLGELPQASQRLFFLALSLAEVAPHIELYRGDPNVPYAFEESRFVAEHGEKIG